MEQIEWESLSYKDKQIELYKNQKLTLDLFVKKGAITKEQYEKSLNDLTEKMGMEDYR